MAYNAFPQRLVQTLNIAAGGTGTTNALVLTEAAPIVHYSVSAGSTFSCWLEGSNDGTNWYTLDYNQASNATTDAATPYFASSFTAHPFVAFRRVRVKVKNTGATAADFVVGIVSTE
jgi:hypothetical protein